MKRAAVYLRVSTDDGRQTTENQRPVVLQMAAGRGYDVAAEHVYTDELSGAKGRRDRPALDALLVAAARGQFSAVFVWALDRLSRDDSFHGGALLIGELDSFNVALLSHQETWCDTSGFLRTALVQFALCIASDSRKRLIARTNAGLDRARAAGKHLGRPAVVIPERALAKARELRAALAYGYRSKARPWREVAAEVKRLGLGQWNHATLARACTKGVSDLPARGPGFRRG